jgi:hypothetical protein
MREYWNLVDERVTNMSHIDGFLIEVDLEAEKDQHLVHDLADHLQPPATPGPHLRADVVDNLHASLLQLARKPQIELGKVDKNSRGRASPVDLP